MKFSKVCYINGRVVLPGSDVSIANGCKCPVIDNCYGEGIPITKSLPIKDKIFIMNEDCPIHGMKNER